MPTDTAPESAYAELLDHVKQLTYVGDAGSVLQWDQQVMMPEGGTPARAKQSSALSSLHHDLLTDDRVSDWLTTLDDADLTPEQQAVVREIRRDHERAVRVPSELVERISEASSNALPVWEEAKAEDDFGLYEDTLAEMVELRREYAAAIDPDRDPYAVLFEEYEPYLGIDTAAAVLERLRDELVPLIDDIAASDVTLAAPFSGTYGDDVQHDLVESALDTLGYDWDRGRLDTAPHPFSTGTQFDARVTTRFLPDDPLDAVGSTIHEFGHATYTLGLPQDEYGTPLGDNRDLSVHESQSRFWENHIGRTRAFWDHFADTANEHLGTDITPQAFYEAANTVHPDNLIRVEADELTYHLHIVLRFEIERDLIRGDLAVEDVPQVWNEKMDEYLGVSPDTDAEGCLQDIHWTNGAIGYFPTYTLGSVLAAQLDHHLRSDVDDVDTLVRDGEFGPIHDWLTESVHRHGARYETDTLIEEATGEPFTADHFISYAGEKYRELYAC